MKPSKSFIAKILSSSFYDGIVQTMSNENKDQSIDVLGIKPVADAIKIVTEETVRNTMEFLHLICDPAAQEFGLLLKDQVRYWRAANIIRISTKAREKFKSSGMSDHLLAHPRLVSKILEEGSWVDNDSLQEMWAGLLASSCSDGGRDDSNLFFVERLAKVTQIQAKIINCGCLNCGKFITPQGLVMPIPLRIPIPKLTEITSESDLEKLDRELDQLRAVNLIEVGFSNDHGLNHDEKYGVDITPTALSLHMYIRCQGSQKTPKEYFGVTSTKSTGKHYQGFDVLE